MLLDFAKRLLRRAPRVFESLSSSTPEIEALLRKVEELSKERRLRESIDVWKAYLEHRPHDVNALNNLGAALATIGQEDESIRYFDLAYSLDDSHLPSIANYANVLKSRNRSSEAMELLAQARIQAPSLPGIRANYASLLFSFGEAAAAIEHTLHAWLGDFDSPRGGDLYLFTATYVEQDEVRLAAEHRFWANTLPPRPHETGPPAPAKPPRLALLQQERRLRVGYWSPDLREHSVRYFFRPLLEGHDRSRHEIYIYYDHYGRDEQTALIEAHADRFFEVASLSDDHLAELLHGHGLDVLVELAGHTSSNRLDMLRYRFASLQVTGLGYPPTTGLASIDAKLLDRHVMDSNMPALYSEAPAVLPQSFWCFDPKAEIAPPVAPPVLANGYITFGCFGNIGKISTEILDCWGQVLARVPDSRLLLRAVNFGDPLRKSTFAQLLLAAGIPEDRFDLLPPTSPRDLFTAYDDIDIVLDTYPFNGGTTTCFAAYSGVPVVSRKGRALASRMGESILKNLGAESWVVDGAEAYVERAVHGAQDIDELSRFRREARQRFETTSLGNGQMFARDVEAFYRNWLENPPPPINESASYVLPAQELVRRALITLRHGQFAAARRIVDYCLALYPHCGAAHVLWTERLTSQGCFGDAADYLRRHRPKFNDAVDQIKALINEARFLFVDGQLEVAHGTLETLYARQDLDHSAVCQRYLLHCASMVLNASFNEASASVAPVEMLPRHIAVCIVTEDASVFETLSRRLSQLDPLPSADVRFIHCHSNEKSRIYQKIAQDGDVDILLCVHANVNFWRSDFWWQLSTALEKCDIVGCHGAKKWDRLDWRTCAQDERCGGYLIPSGEKAGYWEAYALSRDRDGVGVGLGVVDGCLLAIDLHSLRRVENLEFVADLEEAGPLLEEYFSYCAARAGLRVGACARLGVSLDWRIPLSDRYLGPARLVIAEALKIDPWLFPDEENRLWSVSLPSAEQAAATLCAFNAGDVADRFIISTNSSH